MTAEKKTKVTFFWRQMAPYQPTGPRPSPLTWECTTNLYIWTFIVTDVSKPILGADFLSHSDQLIDLAHNHLINGQTFSSTSLHTSRDQALALYYPAKPSIYRSLLQPFPSLTKPCFNRNNIRHYVVHHIVTNGAPVFAQFQHFSPEKQVAKKEFDEMLALGIIRPSMSD